MTDTSDDVPTFDSPTDATAGHVAVLPAEVLDLLQPRPGQVMLDCTLGRAGHASLIAPRLEPGGRYIGLDVDPVNLEYARQVLKSSPVRVDLVKSNFAHAREALDALEIGRVDLVLADLGFASNQMADPARGFSFNLDGPLDMRLDPELTQTAADLVNNLSERELADLIYQYGEERLSRKIARKVVEERDRSPILTTQALAQVVRRAYPPLPGKKSGRFGRSRIDPATRTFMALRIAVNEELGALERLLGALPELVRPGGRVAIISFHSLEDRLVKHAFADLDRTGRARKLTRKPQTAGDAERDTNPRSRSAKLRGIEWAGDI
ncbi:MAG: 16S rRNA (cytosine(1402)-N(4))-methyltransferase RsmH [Phycisphaeraceae bacterium]|nr:16S rRNA (cytosine(1402)-N(4))-methyltransferase RsmH [Phycisphaeraceae bacterium]